MDGSQFDALLRGLTSARSRRGAVVGLLSSALGLIWLSETEAKRHKKKHKKKKGKGSPPVAPPSGCGDGQRVCGSTCIPSNQCCTDADCADSAPRCCRGTCLRPTECCTDADCSQGNTCRNASCSCAPDRVPCGEACCFAPPGWVAHSVTCRTDGQGNPIRCDCDFAVADNPRCGTNCQQGCGISTACTADAADDVCSFCGCTPP